MFVLTKHMINTAFIPPSMPHITASKMTYYAPEAVTNMALVFDKIHGLSLEEKNIAAHALL